jgi:predicted  nucleic acid-binding Zn-ribbon protein
MRAELLSLNEEAARTQHDARVRVAAMASMEADLVGLREVIARGEQEAEARAGEVTRLDREITGLRAAVERAERDAEQQAEARAGEVTRLGGEITGLRAAVERAERAAEQRAAAVKSLEGDLAATQSALIAARQVGRAVINALAIDNSAPLDRLPQLGWRQAMRRWFGFAGSA